MTISSISELGSASTATLTSMHSLADAYTTHDYIKSNVEGLATTANKRNTLFEGSDPGTNSYDSVKMQYSDILSDAILHDVKSFLNTTNLLIDTEKGVDYKFNSVFRGLLSIQQLSVVDNIYALNIYLKNELTVAIGQIRELSALMLTAFYSNISALTACGLNVNLGRINGTEQKALVNNKDVINEIEIGGCNPSGALTVTKVGNKATLVFNGASLPTAAEGNSIHVPIGTIMPYCGPTNGSSDDSMLGRSFLLCDGSSVSKKEYAELFLIIGYTFSTKKSGNSFSLPNLEDGRFLEGINSELAGYDYGKYLDETLPDIRGNFSIPDTITDRNSVYKENAAAQAIYKEDSYTGSFLLLSGENLAPNTQFQMHFLASHGEYSQDDVGEDKFIHTESESIFGKDDGINRVRPKAFQVHFYIKAKVDDSDFSIDKNNVLNQISTEFDWEENEDGEKTLIDLKVATDTDVGGVRALKNDSVDEIPDDAILLLVTKSGTAYIDGTTNNKVIDYNTLSVVGAEADEETSATYTATEDCCVQFKVLTGQKEVSYIGLINDKEVYYEYSPYSSVTTVTILAYVDIKRFGTHSSLIFQILKGDVVTFKIESSDGNGTGNIVMYRYKN